IRFRKIERLPKNRIGHAENRHVGPDAEREREDRHGGEAGVLQQLAKGKFEIIHNAAPPSDRLGLRAWPATSKRGSRQPRAFRQSEGTPPDSTPKRRTKNPAPTLSRTGRAGVRQSIRSAQASSL